MWDLTGSQCRAQSIRDNYVVRPGRTTDEAGSIILKFLKFTEVYRSDFGGIQQEMNYSNQYKTKQKCRWEFWEHCGWDSDG